MFGEPHSDGTIDVHFSAHESDPTVEVILDIDFLLHPAWPAIDHLVLQPTAASHEDRAVTVRIPSDVELSYRFLRRPRREPDKQRTDLDALRALVATGRPDPDVDATIHDAFGSGTTASTLIGPNAAPGHEVWRGGVMATPVAERRVPVTDRTVTVLLPPPEPTRGRPIDRLFVMLDGDVWLSSLGIANAAARWYEGRSAARRTGFVVLPTPDRERLADRDAMSELVVAQVIPAVTEALGIPQHSAKIAIAGQSFGGLAAAGLVVDHGERITTAIISSGSFWFTPERDARDDPGPGALTRQLLDTADRTLLRGHRFMLHVGREEGSMIEQSRMLADAARHAGAEARLEIHPGGHDYAWYRHAVFDALDKW